MTIYFALLRGINVSGHNMIKMPELKRMFEEMGYKRVQTYINSGNVMFEADVSADTLEEKLEMEISRVYGFNIAVFVRSAAELASIICQSPFKSVVLEDKQSIHLTLLKEAPTQEQLDKLPEVEQGEDEYLIREKEIYFLYRQSILDSKLTKKFQKLLPATDRNWKTILKLDAMART
jgi:uncharacterized protein (DUF1697 family)